MEFKGTKGEWKAVELPYKMGLCTHEIQFNEDGECITDGVYGKENALIMAAAPELLKACKMARTEIAKGTADTLTVDVLEKAINKALGQ